MHEANRAPGFTNRVLAKIADRVLCGFPDSFNNVPRYDLACMEISLGRWEEARKVLLNLLALEPKHGDASINLGLSEHRLGRPTEAEAAYRRARDMADSHPRKSSVWFFSGFRRPHVFL